MFPAVVEECFGIFALNYFYLISWKKTMNPAKVALPASDYII